MKKHKAAALTTCMIMACAAKQGTEQGRTDRQLSATSREIYVPRSLPVQATARFLEAQHRALAAMTSVDVQHVDTTPRFGGPPAT
jgi:hypothetical protein